MFEDDIEVHGGYFDYVLVSLYKHVFTGPNQQRNTDYHSNHLFGISLTTPRYDETSIPRKAWTPDQAIGTEEPFFLFQLACSWGALYFPWTWRRYLAYYQWRTKLELPKKIDVIPFSYVNIWERSWKRYLQELMFITGGVMLYPNLLNQTSFSTHHRELGEHTQGKGTTPMVDALGTNNKPIFTVPLLDADFDVQSVLKKMKSLPDLPVVNFYHNRTADLCSCRELGVGSADVLREFGLDLSAYNRNPTCILDYAYPIRFKKSNTFAMSFIPQGTIMEQLEQLKMAFAISHSLGRTLILPDLRDELNNTIPLGRIVKLSLPAPFKLSNAKVDLSQVYRLVSFHNFDSQGNLPKEPHGLPNVAHGVRHIRLPISHGTDHDFQRWFSGCRDPVLLFTNLQNSFSQYVNLQENSLFGNIMEQHFTINIKSIVDSFTKRLGSPFVCVEYYRPDPHLCRKPKYDFKYWRSLYYRSCNATVLKTIQYGHAWTRELPILRHTTSMYLMHNGDSVVPLTISSSGDLVSIFTRQHLKLEEAWMAEAVEEEVCARADFYLGNPYSPRSKRIAEKRQKTRALTAMVGMGIIIPYRNETLAGND